MPETDPATDAYAHFLAEREKILLHKWLVSESRKCDIGFERALTEWTALHRPAWRAARLQGRAEED
jgi:hypothetical protein